MSLSISIIHFLAQLPHVHAAPTQNHTSPKTDFAPSWVLEPDGRGSWSILYSCTFTLALCVWTAIHPNLPRLGMTKLAEFALRSRWVFLSIFAPEIGVLTAFKQYRMSKTLTSELSRLKAEWRREGSGTAATDEPRDFKIPNIDDDLSNEPFSQTYGFYVLMGGLCVNVGDMHDRLTRMTLTPKAVLHLAQKGHFFQISDSDIKDKSKANHLAKALVILQITWMIFQCLSRKISNLPLTVLEIHTLVHAGCALIMYSLWLNKPLDVQEPITVSTAGIEKYIALMLMQNHDSGVPPVGNLIAPVEFRPASLKGAKFGYWPGDQASEASYLIFNPRIAEKSTQSPTSDITGSNGNGVQDYPTAGPQASRRGIAITLNGSETEEQEHPLERLNADPLAGHCSIHSAPSRDSADQVIPSCNQIANIPRKFPKSCIDRRPVMSALKGPTLLKKGQRTQQATFDNKNPFLGVYSTLLAGVDVVSVVSTGEFTSNGIGPSAYITGEIREEYLPKRSADEKVLPLIVEIPKDLQARLPLGEIDPSSVQHYLRLEVALSKADHRRWELAGEALQEDYARGAIAPSDEHSYIGFKNDADTIRNAYLVTHPAMFQMHSYIREIMLSTMYGSENTSDQEHKGFLLVQGFYQSFLELEELSWGSATVVTFLPGFLYGGLHLTLWFYEFPSRAEHLLWRISSTSLIAIPLIPIFLSLAIQISRRRQSRELDSQQDIELHTRPDIRNNYASLGYIQKILIVLAFCAVLFIAALYLFARIFIILESFLSIRHVPISVYSDVTWSKYIPHL